MSQGNDDERVDQFIVYAAYGEVMHQFQVLELILWGFLTRGIKGGSTFGQAMEKVQKWDSTTFGSVVRGLKSQDHWPVGVLDELENAVVARNYLAHHFLREYFIVTPRENIKDMATRQLAEISVRIKQLEESLEEHSVSLGVASIFDLEPEIQDELNTLRPTEWLT